MKGNEGVRAKQGGCKKNNQIKKEIKSKCLAWNDWDDWETHDMNTMFGGHKRISLTSFGSNNSNNNNE